MTALLELYGEEDNVAAMHDLTERFTPRFATLIHDIDEGVAVKGVSIPTVVLCEAHQHNLPSCPNNDEQGVD